VRYQFSGGTRVDDAITDTVSERTFEFDQVLHEGPNTLTITAVAADGTASKPRTYRLTGWTAELGWLQPLLASLPYVGPDAIEFKVYVPGAPIEMLGMDVWLPDKPTKLGPQAVGKLKIPLKGGRYELGLGARYEREKKDARAQALDGPARLGPVGQVRPGNQLYGRGTG
jgi:hypothetical protein